MPAINLLIKPASSACNMRCKYCFYDAIAQARTAAFEGMLSPELLETLTRSAFDYAEYFCGFTFQGGEPTLAGLPFFRHALELQAQYNTRRLPVQNNIQTNGYVIDDEWAQLLHDAHFLVGLSLDGPAELHNQNRIDAAGKGTHARAMNAARLFEKYGVEYNILCVVTGKNARSIETIYRFYRKHGFRYLQFIPCLEPMEQARGAAPYHLSVAAYGRFLIRIFDLWYADLRRGDYVSIRHLDNWLALALGEAPEACNMRGKCSIQYVIEGDGGVYPCDFYVFDAWRLGTIGVSSLGALAESATAQRFIAESLPVPEKCRVCRYAALCRGGCKRDRIQLPGGAPAENFYCEAIRAFFGAREQEFGAAARQILAMRQRGSKRSV